MTLGGTDPDHYKGNITWVSTTLKAYWEFKVDAMEVQGIQLCPGQTSYCIYKKFKVIPNTSDAFNGLLNNPRPAATASIALFE